jgi:hypothetical protein
VAKGWGMSGSHGAQVPGHARTAVQVAGRVSDREKSARFSPNW